MTSNALSRIKNNKLAPFIVNSIVRKILASFDGRMEYRRLRWVICSRTTLTKWEANRILLLLRKEGLIETTRPQANRERMVWLTPQGQEFYWNINQRYEIECYDETNGDDNRK